MGIEIHTIETRNVLITHCFDSLRRFTGDLAEMSSHLTAVDFMQEYIDRNKKEHEHLGNISFVCADVTK